MSNSTPTPQEELKIRQAIHNSLAIEEMKSSDNLFYAGEALGREPTEEEAAMHYAKYATEDFRQRFKFILDHKFSLSEIFDELVKLGISRAWCDKIKHQSIH